ncbi:transcription factor bHLH112-like isoform X2 [Impatiens glandulifera]|uniref:transcription factor bHLH112-like isoform X2 n=1 Tax=Impatiens glandulifera TaxID=253017 RepID=UPI001FB183FC|nr:transcription factor bHLH112-like isoform X2 [Impatiens glandulifera]
MFRDINMGNEFRGSVCGETRWNIPAAIGFTPSSDLETFGSSSWGIKGILSQCAAEDNSRHVLDSGSNLVDGDYLLDSTLQINGGAAATIMEDWSQTTFNNSSTGGERNYHSQILQEEMNSDQFHGGGDAQDLNLTSPNPAAFFLDQINTYGFPYENRQLTMAYDHHHASSSTNFSTDDQVLSAAPNNSPFSPSIFSDQTPLPMWNTSTNFFPSSTVPISSCLMDSSDNLDESISHTDLNSLAKSKKKIKNYNSDHQQQQPLITKRPRIETPSHLPTFKVRKEKMGDRITALQQLVSPFGKTDTASVLHEAIDYIKFLHDQVNALSSPYLKNGNPINQQLHQQINEHMMKKSTKRVDLKSRGLCLVPISISSTFPVASETTADFWTPTTTFGGGFR